jgi:hypothetical protein
MLLSAFLNDVLAREELHRPLFVSQSDTHLLKRHTVQGARDFDRFGRLIFLQAGASVRVELAGLLATVEAAVPKNRLSLLNLVFVCPKDGTTFFLCGRSGRAAGGGRVGVLRGPCQRRSEEKRKYYRKESFHLSYPLLVRRGCAPV